jgi:glycosyltransferase domain-containing protein
MSKKRNNLNDLTIIIPTYERKNFLIRQIKYLANWEINLIIADGSRDELIESEILELNQLRKFEYLNLHENYVKRVDAAAQNIKTNYAMCLADDDFYLKSGLQEAINLLELNEDAIACMGQSVGLDRIYKKYYTFPYGNNLRAYNIDQETASQRIQYGLSNYRPATPYAVFRTPVFKYVWQNRSAVSCLEVVEYENCIRSLQKGKVITGKSVYWVRSFETNPIASEVDGTRKTNFYGWYTSNKYINEIDSFKNRIIASLIDTNQISEKDANFLYESIIKKIITNSHSTLVEKTTISKIYNSIAPIVNANSIARIIRMNIFWIKFVRPLLTFALRKKFKINNAPISFNANELQDTLVFCEENQIY